MEKQEQREKEAEEAINAINKKTGRNMPQAIATAVVLIAIILACLLMRRWFVRLSCRAVHGARIVGAARRFRHRGIAYSVVALSMFRGDFAGHLLQQASYCGYDGLCTGLLAACSDRREVPGDVRQSAFPGRGGQTVAHRCRCSSRIVVQS